MGIKGLWSVLSPFNEKKSLHEIRGETLAIDLSGWVCDSQNVTDYYVQPKLYLRNLFFRTIYLLLSDVNPIFVLEGDAPELKRDVMAARNAIQFCGAAPKTDAAANKKPDTGRRRFKGVQRECATLLKYMGVCCIKGSGEAEATCAELNDQGELWIVRYAVENETVEHVLWHCEATEEYRVATGLHELVDAVISQDSDCFAYGARRVYRNFSVSSAAGGGALQGSIDCYDAEKMFQSNGFGRKKMVALALLCGCDYGAGACGSSITTAVGFLHTVPEADVIPRLLSWVSETEQYEELRRWTVAPGRCDRCGHVGRTHLKKGCPVCATHKGCADVGHKAKVAEAKRELTLRSRALSCGMLFPEPKVMKEFLKRTPDEIQSTSLKRPPPSLIQFVKLMTNKLGWSERYSVEKFLPLMTKWHLQDKVPCKTLKPAVIKKKRTPKGVPSFEVVWEDIDGQYEELIPDDQYEDNEDRSVPWTSIERQDLMRQYYPGLVAAYEESIKKPAKEKNTRGRKKKDEEQDKPDKPKRKYNRKPKPALTNLNESMKALEIVNHNTSQHNVSVKINKLKRKIKNNKKGTQKTIDSFIAKKRKSSIKLMESLQNSFRNISISNEASVLTDDKENEKSHWLSMFDKSAEEIPESDLSDIIDAIISKPSTSKTVRVNNNLVKLVFGNSPMKISSKRVLTEIRNNCSTPNDSPVRRNSIFNPKMTPENSPIRRNSVVKRQMTAKNSTIRRNPIFSIKMTTKNSPVRRSSVFGANYASTSLNNSKFSNVNTSYFFDKVTGDRDAFELSLDHKSAVINLDCDTTTEYSLPDVIV